MNSLLIDGALVVVLVGLALPIFQALEVILVFFISFLFYTQTISLWYIIINTYRNRAFILVKFASDEIPSVLNRYEVIHSASLDIAQVFDRVWPAGLLYKLKSWSFRLYFGRISSFLSNKQLSIVLEESLCARIFS